MQDSRGVYDSAKILIWKQITTSKGTNPSISSGVYDSAKILIWKQITTPSCLYSHIFRCIWLCKDTNLKANHNSFFIPLYLYLGVYDSAKILIWKQITTAVCTFYFTSWCIWLCKDTNLKANHNQQAHEQGTDDGVYDSAKILIWKQITTRELFLWDCSRCIWLCKDTNLKANHNCSL